MWTRRREVNRGLPDGWADLLRRYVAVWRRLDDDERERLTAFMDHLLTTRNWEAAGGFELTDRMLVVVSAQASLLLLGFDDDEHYSDVSTVILHPSLMTFEKPSRGPSPGTETYGPVDLIGQATYRGPVLIAWDAASANARHPEWGRDVVLHEFAHKLDMSDGIVDGTPPLAPGPFAERWIQLNTDTYMDLLDRGDDVIDDYGATDPGEFFAVVSELFFTVPLRLKEIHPDLYELFMVFYRQDTAFRAELPERRD